MHWILHYTGRRELLHVIVLPLVPWISVTYFVTRGNQWINECGRTGSSLSWYHNRNPGHHEDESMKKATVLWAHRSCRASILTDHKFKIDSHCRFSRTCSKSLSFPWLKIYCRLMRTMETASVVIAQHTKFSQKFTCAGGLCFVTV